MVPKQIENELHDAVPRFVDTRIGGDLFQDRFAGLAKWFPCCGHFVANVVSRPPGSRPAIGQRGFGRARHAHRAFLLPAICQSARRAFYLQESLTWLWVQ